MSVQTNKALVLDYVERVWNGGNETALDELTTPTFRYWMGSQPGRDHAQMRQLIRMLHTAFPDWSVKVVEIVAEENTVVIRWEGNVTHLGTYQGIPATGKQIAVNGINMYHIIGGKVATEWEQTHVLGWLQQMGVLPATEEKPG
ncbi:ester cyclase [Ktedonosporobacter rubrisoli]|uniref:Ester cyclase n=1 Tax=Ktedonosporobacter rubrisoli TaxID=2509675 RepID=A0A4V0YZ16_KTERU|nr:ester cyclase [Ktedonosporobacter rubrisoli]QBD78151.1 ester cyclase [Ktedonosporobacter rubrisoli]